jgi:Xaa-Pro aminopeptidase
MTKLNRVRKKLQELGMDALLVLSDINRAYLTDFTGSEGIVLITRTDAYLLVDSRYTIQAKGQVSDFTVEEYSRSQTGAVLNEKLAAAGVKTLGFEEHFITYAEYRRFTNNLSVELVPAPPIIEDIRLIKSDVEVAKIRKACEISDAAFTHILTFIKEGITELEIANELEAKMRSLGASGSAFDMIVASGERSALPHGGPTERKLQAGDLLTLDFGAIYNGYLSDMTRTITIGEPNEQLKEIYKIVSHALENGLQHIKAGMTGDEVDALTRDIITEAGYGPYFGHSTGHGVGMYIHEGIALAKGSKDIVKPGMILTIEPGIYLPGIGGVRIEDDVFIKEDGIEILTKSPKELINIKTL